MTAKRGSRKDRAACVQYSAECGLRGVDVTSGRLNANTRYRGRMLAEGEYSWYNGSKHQIMFHQMYVLE